MGPISKAVVKTAVKVTSLFKISPEVEAWARRKKTTSARPSFAPYVPPPGAVPSGHKMAMDDSSFTWAQGSISTNLFNDDIAFIGYSELALLAARPEFRRISEITATEMTRKWLKIQAKGDKGDKTDKIAKLTSFMEKLDVKGVFCKSALQDGFFGRGHVFIDIGNSDDREEIKKSIGDGTETLSTTKVGIKNPIKRLQAIEAVWTYPSSYNADDPTRPDWYKPSTWFVMGKEIHSTRLLTFIGREMPDLLKPAYAFGGLSLTQMAKSYVDNWIKTRISVSDIISAFSVFVLKTNLSTLLQQGNELEKRIDFFNAVRDNKGVLAIDKTTEEFENIAAPLTTLDVLQAQSLEHICSVTAIPVVKYTGIQPTGLNADSEGIMRSFHDWIAAYQELLFTKNFQVILNFMQLSLFNEVDADITFAWEPLRELDEKEQAEVKEIEARTASEYINNGTISQEEERQALAADPDSRYAGLDVQNLPEAPDDTDAETSARGLRPGDKTNQKEAA